MAICPYLNKICFEHDDPNVGPACESDAYLGRGCYKGFAGLLASLREDSTSYVPGEDMGLTPFNN